MVVFKFRLTVVIVFSDYHDYHDYHGNIYNSTERFAFYLMHSILQFIYGDLVIFKYNSTIIIRLLFFHIACLIECRTPKMSFLLFIMF